MTVDTRKVTDRRQLHYASSAEMLADAERLAEAERAGTLRATGNWTLGQALNHIATWNDFPYDGYPPQARPPWFIKLIARLMKNRLMRGKMPTGMKIPRVPGGTLGIEPVPTDEALEHLRRSTARLEAAPPEGPNPALGPLTHDQWKRMELGHAELHLSFFHPEG